MRPVHLNNGDKVKLIAPAGAVSQEKFDKLLNIVRTLGLEPIWSPIALSKYGYFSAPDKERLEDLISGFKNKDIKAIFCLRGGYGSTRLLKAIPYSIIRRNPKIFLGFSDITALQMAFYKKTRLITFHTSLNALENEYARTLFKKMAFEAQTPALEIKTNFSPEPMIINPGRARGTIVGGNLSLLVSLIGTGFLPRFKNKIVFIEEISEPPYKIDRMLTQLLMATDLLKAAGIVLGIFHKCQWQKYYQKKEDTFSLVEIFKDRFARFKGPVIYGFPLGHVKEMSILPMGALASFDTDTMKIKLHKPVVR